MASQSSFSISSRRSASSSSSSSLSDSKRKFSLGAATKAVNSSNETMESSRSSRGKKPKILSRFSSFMQRFNRKSTETQANRNKFQKNSEQQKIESDITLLKEKITGWMNIHASKTNERLSVAELLHKASRQKHLTPLLEEYDLKTNELDIIKKEINELYKQLTAIQNGTTTVQKRETQAYSQYDLPLQGAAASTESLPIINFATQAQMQVKSLELEQKINQQGSIASSTQAQIKEQLKLSVEHAESYKQVKSNHEYLQNQKLQGPLLKRSAENLKAAEDKAIQEKTKLKALMAKLEELEKEMEALIAERQSVQK